MRPRTAASRSPRALGARSRRRPARRPCLALALAPAPGATSSRSSQRGARADVDDGDAPAASAARTAAGRSRAGVPHAWWRATAAPKRATPGRRSPRAELVALGVDARAEHGVDAGARPSARMAATVASSTPAARPRQPAWAAPTTPSSATSATGAQSPTQMPSSGAVDRVVTSASPRRRRAGAGLAVDDHDVVPCTWRARSTGRRRPRAAGAPVEPASAPASACRSPSARSVKRTWARPRGVVNAHGRGRRSHFRNDGTSKSSSPLERGRRRRRRRRRRPARRLGASGRRRPARPAAAWRRPSGRSRRR